MLWRAELNTNHNLSNEEFVLTTPASLKYAFVLCPARMRLFPPLKTAIINIPNENMSLAVLHWDLCWISGAKK